MAAYGPLVGAVTAASVALGLAGCGHRSAGACSVTCGTSQICPEGLTCAVDGFCHGDEDPADCTGWADAAPDVDSARGEDDADSCAGVTDAISDSDSADVAIPDGDTVGIDRTITFDASCVTVHSVQVRVEIAHPYRGDIELRLTSPGHDTDVLLKSSDDPTPDISATFDSVVGDGEIADGDWVLNVRDVYQTDAGTLEYWSIGINQDAP
jgi:hypothetical protein